MQIDHDFCRSWKLVFIVRNCERVISIRDAELCTAEQSTVSTVFYRYEFNTLTII